MRLAAAAVTAILAGLGATAATAQAARFTAEPPKYVQSGAGPFEWRWESDDPMDPDGPVAYEVWQAYEDLRFGTVWDRCSFDAGVGLANLKEGRYSVTIADDPEPCSSATGPPASVQTTSTLIVDGTPPTIGAPVVTRKPYHLPGFARAEVQVAVHDRLSGIASLTWNPGDGSPAELGTFTRNGHPRSPFSRLYRAGTWTGTVTAVDLAGNTASRTFTFTVAPAPRRARDKAGPAIDVDRVGKRLAGGRALEVAVRLAERGRASATATVRIAGRVHRLRKDGAKLSAPGLAKLRLAADAHVRHAIRRALAKRRAVRADVRIVAADVLGNDTVVRRTVAIRG